MRVLVVHFMVIFIFMLQCLIALFMFSNYRLTYLAIYIWACMGKKSYTICGNKLVISGCDVPALDPL